MITKQKKEVEPQENFNLVRVEVTKVLQETLSTVEVLGWQT